MWLVWKEHNAQTFEDIERPIDLLKTLLVRTLFEWSRIWGLTHCSSLSDLLFLLDFPFDLIVFFSLLCVYNRQHIALLL